MSTAITEAEIVAGIPDMYRGMLLVSSAELSRAHMPVVEAFWEAVRRFGPTVRAGRIAHVLFATAPFQVHLTSGKLVFAPHEGVINVAIEHMVFIDVRKMLGYPPEIQVACIIEELVHAVMHIADENLTSHIVAWLYPGVVLIDGKYAVAPSS